MEVIALTESIQSIFDQNIKLLSELDKAVYYFRGQQYEKALILVAESIDKVRFVIEAIIKEREHFKLASTDPISEMLSGILEAKKNNDFILLADILELQLISFLTGIQELVISKDEVAFNKGNYRENIDLLLQRGLYIPQELQKPVDTAKLLKSGYRVEFTSSGLMTLAAENGGLKFYFHTNNKVEQEARLLAGSWQKENTSRYILYGFGMGYHVRELVKQDSQAHIEVYEADLNVLMLACAFTDVKELLLNERVTVIYDPGFVWLKDRIANIKYKDEFVLHYPSYKNIRSKKGKALFVKAFPWLKSLDEC